MRPQRIPIALALLAITSSAMAGCVLPVPDGGDSAPSKPNLIGDVISTKPGVLLIRKVGSTAPIQIRTEEATTYTKLYGGWLRRDDLRPGQRVWIWYKDCRAALTGQPEAAYLRLVAEPGGKP
jgi:hypothetical protein